MKLQTRLRVFVLVLLIAVISVLSLLNLYSLGWAAFQDVLQRAEMSSQQVKSFLIQRLKELMADRPAPRTFEETKATWRGLVSSDDELALFLQNTTANSPVIVEIAVAGEGGHILADSSPSRVGRHAPDLPNLAKWAKRSAWGKLFEVFTERRDYEITVPLGVPGQQQPVFTVNVVLSSVLLRQLVLPQIQRIGLIFLGALLLSMVLSIVVSNLVMRPLHDISYAIDRISRGELAPTAIADGAGEFASMQSKLNLLGQQFYGARQDAVQLRGNIERLLARLEEVVFLFDRDDHLVMAGHDADRILGKGRWELLGRPLTAVFPLSSPIGAAIRHAIESREPIKDLPLTLEREEAPPIRLLVNVEMLEAFPDHQRIGTLIALRDAETRRQIQSQLDVSALGLDQPADRRRGARNQKPSAGHHGPSGIVEIQAGGPLRRSGPGNRNHRAGNSAPEPRGENLPRFYAPDRSPHAGFGDGRAGAGNYLSSGTLRCAPGRNNRSRGVPERDFCERRSRSDTAGFAQCRHEWDRVHEAGRETASCSRIK